MKRIQTLTRVHSLHTDWGITADGEAKAISAPRDGDLQGDTCQVGEQPQGVTIPPRSHTAPQPLEMLAHGFGEMGKGCHWDLSGGMGAERQCQTEPRLSGTPQKECLFSTHSAPSPPKCKERSEKPLERKTWQSGPDTDFSKQIT